MNSSLRVPECARFLGVLFLFCVFTHLMVIANPGFFSHDEWQKYDHVSTAGLGDFVARYGEFKAGPDFGYPVRPLGFIQQGFASIFMVDAPWISHFIEVMVHFANVMVFMLLLGQMQVSRRTINIAALLFVISPLSITSTGWSAASFDRIYPFFAMWAILFAWRIHQAPGAGGWVNYVGLLIAGLCASLSKETAFMLPVLIAVGFLAMELHRTSLRDIFYSPRIYGVCLAIGLPFLMYLLVRLPALLVSFGGDIDSVYEPESTNIVQHLFFYWAYPFVNKALEMSSMQYMSSLRISTGALIHLALLGLVAFHFGWKRAVAYVLLYFVFLVPVISITNNGAHYLYAATPVLSAALAGLLALSLRSGKRLLLAFMVLLVVFSTVRFVQIQSSLYQQGLCQMRLIHSLEAQLPSVGGGEASSFPVLIDTSEASRGYVAVRTFLGRSYPGSPFGHVNFLWNASDFTEEMSAGLSLKMTSACYLKPN
ncbi:hypothetical protein [Cellvibrio polysaccharolyticus]|uniref:Uncharacterized protein n=1 Tax=Cellvibrio polysaccharolyticus TaxID=2082724 RepID=A0A928UZS9_9GAMM|nr:hypothetical protein [Cellvibrio polysaccharolyticus]MBE8716230.1 hypothetical protein [Cellvibrio polysaccharolyticus]